MLYYRYSKGKEQNKILYKIIKFYNCTLKIVQQNKETELKKAKSDVKSVNEKNGIFSSALQAWNFCNLIIEYFLSEPAKTDWTTSNVR